MSRAGHAQPSSPKAKNIALCHDPSRNAIEFDAHALEVILTLLLELVHLGMLFVWTTLQDGQHRRLEGAPGELFLGGLQPPYLL